MASKNAMIGVFDSGVGGLTVVKALQELLPNEQICYLADSINLPYGNKSPQDLQQVCMENIHFLVQQPLKALVIACNTASAHVYETIQKRFNVPIFDVITPSVDEALSHSQNKKIAVLGSEATIASKVYEKLICSRCVDAEVISIACPLLATVVEENLLEHQLSQMLVRQYLHPLEDADVDVVILGCTHYPLIEKTITEELPEHVDIINSGFCSVKQLKGYLEKNSLLETRKSAKPHQFYVSGDPERFNKISSSLLNQKVNSLKREN